MNHVLLRILAVVLSGVSPEKMEKKIIPLEKLSAVCPAVFDAGILQLKQVTTTTVLSTDLDGDHEPELLIFNGDSGSGGEGWTIMQKHNGQYLKTGAVFGILYKSGNGLIVESPCGWEQATWRYYELVNRKLELRFKIDVKYSLPVRKKPVNINIKVMPATIENKKPGQ